MNIRRLVSLLLITTALSSASYAQTVYTWTGTSSDLSLDTNWTPAGGPPTSFLSDDAIFNATGTTKTGLAPNGGFAVRNLTFTGAAYSFAAASGGDTIGIGDGTGTLSILSSASVNFSDQTVVVTNSMNWIISGTSSFTGGLVTVSDFALGINFGVAQQNTARFGSLSLGASGTLAISNWGGALGVYGGANNQLRFSVDPTAYLSKISFTGYAGSTAATQNMGSYYEVVAVPEPTTWALLAGSLTTVMIFRRRRSKF